MRQDLHISPALLRDALQKEIDLIESGNDLHTNERRFGEMEAILLGYGLCSNALVGLKSSRLDLGLDLGQADIERKRSEYMERFDGDEDTVEYLLDMDKEMLKNYHYVTYITWPGMPNENGIDAARKIAEDSGMELLQYEGSNQLMADFVNGNWNEENFLILQPGQTLQPSYDEMVMKRMDVHDKQKTP